MIRDPLPVRRRGLATLEMVLSLPILLFVMALMVNFATVACWKVRALSMAREAVWSTRWPRTGGSNPRPGYWPPTAGVGENAAGEVPALDDPRVDRPVARGPSLPLGTTVHEELLDPTRGLRRGSASITREFPLLARLGPYDLQSRTHLLDDKWQYLRMKWPEQGYRLYSNLQRRIPVIYALAKAPPSFGMAHVNAARQILEAPFRAQLDPLDRDDEFIYYSLLFGWGGGAPDFHPRLQEFCSLDLEVARGRVEQLVDRIRGKAAQGSARRIPSVAERMADRFIRLYRRVLRAFESLDTSGMTPGEVADLTARIGQLEAKIDVLRQFLAMLRSTDGN